jgi:hypothetical protein
VAQTHPRPRRHSCDLNSAEADTEAKTVELGCGSSGRELASKHQVPSSNPSTEQQQKSKFSMCAVEHSRWTERSQAFKTALPASSSLRAPGQSTQEGGAQHPSPQPRWPFHSASSLQNAHLKFQPKVAQSPCVFSGCFLPCPVSQGCCTVIETWGKHKSRGSVSINLLQTVPTGNRRVGLHLLDFFP